MESEHNVGMGEKSIDETLQAARKIIHPKTGIVKNLGQIFFFNDEPKICTFVANLCDTSVFSDCYMQDEITGGVSFDNKIAELRALAEAMERYCSAIYREKDFVTAACRDIENAVDPKEFQKFSSKQLSTSRFRSCRFDEKTEFRWTKSYSFFKRKKIMVPAQLVYVPYRFRKERIIRLPISTGSACGSTYSSAIYRGLCEVAERDAFMIYYLNKIPAIKVDLEASENDAIRKLVSVYRRYRLEIRVFDITTDIKIPVFLSVLVDRTGKGPAITVGAKAGLDAEKAIIGAMEETYLTRPWIRELLLKPDREKVSESKELLDDIDERGIFWSKRNMIKHLDFLLNSRDTKDINEYRKVGRKNILEVCFSFLRKMDVFFSDLTTPEIREIGFKVVKILIPQMHPLHLNEGYKYLGGERLYSVPETLGFNRKREGDLNKIPHPFL